MQRNTLGFVAVLLALAAVPTACAAKDSLVGSWRTVIDMSRYGGTGHCTEVRVITESRTYSSTVTCPRGTTMQSGTYTVFPEHTVGFKATDWEPKTRPVRDASGAIHYEDNPQPPGGMVEYSFSSPDTLVTRDINVGETTTYQRVR